MKTKKITQKDIKRLVEQVLNEGDEFDWDKSIKRILDDAFVMEQGTKMFANGIYELLDQRKKKGTLNADILHGVNYKIKQVENSLYEVKENLKTLLVEYEREQEKQRRERSRYS